MISVLLPFRNAERFIAATLDGMLAQTHRDFEVLCVDNGSTDRSREILDNYCSRSGRLRYLYVEPQGKALAVNHAICESAREWVAICDADDVWLPDKLRLQVAFIRDNPSVDILGTQMRYIDENGEPNGRAPVLPVRHEDIVRSILVDLVNPICNSSAVYRRSIHFEAVGFYDPLLCAEDYDFWSRCAIHGRRFANLDAELVDHRLHRESAFNGSDFQAGSKRIIDARNTALVEIRRAE